MLGTMGWHSLHIWRESNKDVTYSHQVHILSDLSRLKAGQIDDLVDDLIKSLGYIAADDWVYDLVKIDDKSASVTLLYTPVFDIAVRG